MSDKFMLQPWKGYNCFAATIGTLLLDDALPYIPFAVNTDWDFYFNPEAVGQIDMAGVYAGTVHPSIVNKARNIYGQELIYYHFRQWQECKAFLKYSYRPMLCVCNKACPHIPQKGSRIPLVHYLILTGCNGYNYYCYDSFLDCVCKFTEEELTKAMQLSGTDDAYTVASLSLPYTLTHPQYKDYMPVYNEEMVASIKSVPVSLVAYHEDLLRESIMVLVESFRYVQYQRKYFVNSLSLIAALHPFLSNKCESLSVQADDIADEWFRLRIRMQYNLKSRSSGLLDGITDGFERIAGMEERFLKNLV